MTSGDITTADFALKARSAQRYDTRNEVADPTYNASSSPLLRAEEDPTSVRRGNTDGYKLPDYLDYYTATPGWVTGLPPSLVGEEVNIRSTIDTRSYPYAVHLGADKTEEADYYEVKSGAVDLRNGSKANTLTITGPLDYCVNSGSDYRVCTERLGQLTVTIKPVDFDSRCEELKLQLQQAIAEIK